MDEHRAIDFVQDILTNVDRVVGTNTEDVGIECRVMQFAERDAVGHARHPICRRVADDVRCVEEFLSLQPADCAGPMIGLEDSLPEFLLMESLLNNACGIPTADVPFMDIVQIADSHKTPLVDVDRERQGAWIISDNKHRIAGEVSPSHDAMEVDERRLLCHSRS